MITGIILAAGAARRMGKIKQLLPWGQKTLLWQVANTACRSQLEEVLLVTGAACERFPDAVSDLPLRIIHNPDWEEGLSSSLKSALRAVQPQTVAVVFFLADQPLVGPELVDALIAAYRHSGKSIICPVHEGKRGNPVLLDLTKWRDALSTLSGDQGARQIIADHPEEVGLVPVDSATVFLDVDTEEDYRRLCNLQE